jgi:putative membrane protein
VVLLAAAGSVDYWRWVPHPEVWVLIGGLTALYVYAIRVIGPKAVPTGTPAATTSQKRWFAFGIILLWLAADWPVHDIGEEYLYFVHMIQHLVLTLVVPPVMLLATPEWLARLVVGQGRVERIVRRMARPVPAALVFNALVLLSHWQLIVNTASANGLFHYAAHTVLVTAAVLFWIPVCGPFPELRISAPAQMIYLFVTSIIPTVPGAWLTFADGAVYSVYDIPNRLWGVSVTSDQQVAGLLMKLVGGTYLWVIITVIFFRWAAREHEDGHRRAPEDAVLTWDQVAQELGEQPAPTP